MMRKIFASLFSIKVLLEKKMANHVLTLKYLKSNSAVKKLHGLFCGWGLSYLPQGYRATTR